MCIVTACGDPSETEPPESEATQQIAFSSTRITGSRDLFLMDPDGSNVRTVLSDAAVNETPVLSPDGRRIAFVSDRDGNDEIYVVDIDGSGLSRLTNSPAEEGAPTWSPDGARLAFSRSTASMDGNGVFLINADGTGETMLAAGFQGGLAWSPDNASIAYEATDGIWVLSVDGGERSLLFATDLPAHDPAWSPDGSMIAFGGFANDNQEIFVANADGTGLRNLTQTPTPAGEIQPAWSPDGDFIVFTGFRGGNQQIVRRNLDGTGEQILTNLGAEDQHPSWGPVP